MYCTCRAELSRVVWLYRWNRTNLNPTDGRGPPAPQPKNQGQSDMSGDRSTARSRVSLR